MPERKGRRRRPQRTRRVSGDPSEPGADKAARASERATEPPATVRETNENTIPALRARYLGFIVAVLTLTIGVLTLAQGLVGDYGAADAALRVGAGGALIIVALVIGVLALIPGRIAAWLRRS